MRFDEVELEVVQLENEQTGRERRVIASPAGQAPRWRRFLTLLTDLSLFAALVLALSPILPQPATWLHAAALCGFAILVSYYYFVGTWVLWGKTIGGAIFDVRIVPETGNAMSLNAASMRWAAMLLSLSLGGLGFLLAALPSRRSLPDRLSHTKCV